MRLLLLLSFSCFAAPPPEAKYLHHIWRTEDGLPNPVIRAVLQSRDGYLWLGTDESVVRFDGARFVEFDRLTPGTEKLMRKTDRWRVALMEARDGSIWVSSINGGITRIKNGKVMRYTTEQGLLHDFVLCAREDSKGDIWIGTAAGLSCFSNGKIVNYTNQPGLIVEAVRDILEDKQGSLWIGTAKGLSRMRDGNFTSYTTNDLLVYNAVMCLHEDKRGALWIGTSAGLTRVVNGKPTHYTMTDGLAHNVVRAVLEDSRGNIWIGTQAGIQLFHEGNFYPVNIRSLNDPDFEGILFVYSLCEDREGNLWIGTNLGLNLIQAQKFKTYGSEEGLSHNLATSVLEDREGNVWIGTYGGGLCRLHGGKMECWTRDKGLSSNFILALAQDRAGALWIGTESGGLNRFQNGDFTHFTISEEPRANTVRVILEDSQGTLWIGANNGLHFYKDGRFVQDERIASTEVKDIVEGRDRSLLVAAKPGLTKLTSNTSQTYRLEVGLSSDVVNTVYEDKDGIIWTGNNMGGLNRIGRDNKITVFSKVEGPFNEHVVQILEDNFSSFWLGTRNGVFRVRRSELNEFAEGKIPAVTFVSYGKKDGMRRAQCNGIAQPAGIKTSDGRVWFPTMHGVVVFDPNDAARNRFPPPVLVEEITVDDKPIVSTTPAFLPPSDGDIEFRYTALSFRSPEKVRFKYRLEGFDQEWRDAGTRRTARYTNLRPGDYRFQVKACNDDGLWNETGAIFAFSLAPHFYETVWFYSLCGIAMILGGAAINLFRLRRARARELQLVELVEHRTAKLKQAITTMESFNYSIAHDLRAPLRAIKGLTGALLEDYSAAFDATAQDYSARIRQAVDRMDRLISDLLTFGRITHKEVNCAWVKTDLLLAKILRELDNEISKQNAVIKLSPLPQMWANEMLLEQSLVNLVTNALKFMPAGVAPYVQISGEETATMTKIVVQDNGIGIEPAHHTRIFGVFERLHADQTYPGTGIGLAIVQKAIERMDGKVGVQSTVGKGSCFWIELPKPKSDKDAKGG